MQDDDRQGESHAATPDPPPDASAAPAAEVHGPTEAAATTTTGSTAPRPRGGPPTAEDLLAPHRHLVGILADAAVADRAGLLPIHIQAAREGRPLPPPPRPARRQRKLKRRVPPEAEDERLPEERLASLAHLIGILSDAAIAERAGVGILDVVRFRSTRSGASASIVDPPTTRADEPAAAPSDQPDWAPPEIAAEPRAGAQPAEPRHPSPAPPPEPAPDAVEAAPSAAPSRSAANPRPQTPPPPRPSKIAPYHALVGTVADSVIARKAGVTAGAVARYREYHGIASALRQGERWGSRPVPAELAVASAPAPAAEPRQLDAEPAPARTAPAPPPPGRGSKLDAHRDIIGVLPDREVATRAGVSRALVHAYRQRHGIAAPARAPRRPETRPRRPRRSPGSKLDAHRDIIGVLSDREVARRAGVTRAAVKAYRGRRGIAPSVPWAGSAVARKVAPVRANASPPIERTASPPLGARRSKLDAVAHLVGVLTDREVAERVGLSAGAVYMHRRSRGIPSAVPRGQHAPAPPAAVDHVAPALGEPEVRSARARATASGTTMWGWKLTLLASGGEVIRYVVAVDARAAVEAGSHVGEVVAVEQVGEALG